MNHYLWINKVIDIIFTQIQKKESSDKPRIHRPLTVNAQVPLLQINGFKLRARNVYLNRQETPRLASNKPTQHGEMME